MKSTRGAGNSFNFVQVEQGTDLNYIKEKLSEIRDRLDGPTFVEQRAQ